MLGITTTMQAIRLAGRWPIMVVTVKNVCVVLIVRYHSKHLCPVRVRGSLGACALVRRGLLHYVNSIQAL